MESKMIPGSQLISLGGIYVSSLKQLRDVLNSLVKRIREKDSDFAQFNKISDVFDLSRLPTWGDNLKNTDGIYSWQDLGGGRIDILCESGDGTFYIDMRTTQSSIEELVENWILGNLEKVADELLQRSHKSPSIIVEFISLLLSERWFALSDEVRGQDFINPPIPFECWKDLARLQEML